MPRPGPRPYECVTRPWHSDRHQPIRGSIIQQIFRVVNEVHNSATRKNREWQEKLPRVVLKVEEIMYSKANSEAEYMDPDTLWERLNDAVNTIIRREESMEMGKFLQPCIEAALVLGCVPVRGSHSQQHGNQRSYLNPRYQEYSQAVPLTAERTLDHRGPSQPQTSAGNQLTGSRSTTANQTCSTSPFNNQTIASSDYIARHAGPHLQPYTSQGPFMAIEPNTSLNFGSMCPSYYGSHRQNFESQCRFRSPHNPKPNNIIVGTPVGWPAGQPSHFASTRNLLYDESTVTIAEKLRQVNPVDPHGNAADKACDLSLRLGPSDPCTSSNNELGYVTKDGGLNIHWNSSKRSKLCDKNLEFCFLPKRDASNNPYGSCNSKLEHEGKFQEYDANLRKRNALGLQEWEDGCTEWLAKLQTNQFCGRSRWPGL